MVLMTPDQYEESLKSVKPRLFINGKQTVMRPIFQDIFIPRNCRDFVLAKISFKVL